MIHLHPSTSTVNGTFEMICLQIEVSNWKKQQLIIDLGVGFFANYIIQYYNCFTDW